MPSGFAVFGHPARRNANDAGTPMGGSCGDALPEGQSMGALAAAPLIVVLIGLGSGGAVGPKFWGCPEFGGGIRPLSLEHSRLSLYITQACNGHGTHTAEAPRWRLGCTTWELKRLRGTRSARPLRPKAPRGLSEMARIGPSAAHNWPKTFHLWKHALVLMEPLWPKTCENWPNAAQIHAKPNQIRAKPNPNFAEAAPNLADPKVGRTHLRSVPVLHSSPPCFQAPPSAEAGKVVSHED